MFCMSFQIFYGLCEKVYFLARMDKVVAKKKTLNLLQRKLCPPLPKFFCGEVVGEKLSLMDKIPDDICWFKCLCPLRIWVQLQLLNMPLSQYICGIIKILLHYSSSTSFFPLFKVRCSSSYVESEKFAIDTEFHFLEKNACICDSPFVVQATLLNSKSESPAEI